MGKFGVGSVSSIWTLPYFVKPIRGLQGTKVTVRNAVSRGTGIINIDIIKTTGEKASIESMSRRRKRSAYKMDYTQRRLNWISIRRKRL